MTILRSPEQLRRDALAIWHAGVEAVRSDQLVRENVQVDGDWLVIGDQTIELNKVRRIAVVGTGKAGAGMAAGLVTALGPEIVRRGDEEPDLYRRETSRLGRVRSYSRD